MIAVVRMMEFKIALLRQFDFKPEILFLHFQLCMCLPGVQSWGVQYSNWDVYKEHAVRSKCAARRGQERGWEGRRSSSLTGIATARNSSFSSYSTQSLSACGRTYYWHQGTSVGYLTVEFLIEKLIGFDWLLLWLHSVMYIRMFDFRVTFVLSSLVDFSDV